MLLAASANDFILMFVALELVDCDVLRARQFPAPAAVLPEAGVSISSSSPAAAFMVYGIALIFRRGQLNQLLRNRPPTGGTRQVPVFVIGLP